LEIRAFLKEHGNDHYVKSIRVFFGKFLGRPNLINTFKVPQCAFKPKHVPSKNDLRLFFDELVTLKEKVIFLLLASSGLRFHEVMELRRCDVDVETNMIKPRIDGSRTKRSWVGFFNLETRKLLIQYLKDKVSDEPLFSNAKKPGKIKVFKKARKKFPKITPKTLREWFCSEMGSLGVPDRYVDGFCGRTPKSVLARHYTDYAPKKLKEIYDKANLRVIF
jgi:integrase